MTGVSDAVHGRWAQCLRGKSQQLAGQLVSWSCGVADGEVCVVLADGRTSFQALQNLGREDRRRLVYFAFDLLALNGRSLVADPLETRKAALKRIVRGSRMQFAEHLDGDGPDAYREACRLGLEGIISKLRGQPYQSGKRTGWVKTKCTLRQEFVIGGFTDPEGSAPTKSPAPSSAKPPRNRLTTAVNRNQRDGGSGSPAPTG